MQKLSLHDYELELAWRVEKAQRAYQSACDGAVPNIERSRRRTAFMKAKNDYETFMMAMYGAPSNVTLH